MAKGSDNTALFIALPLVLLAASGGAAAANILPPSPPPSTEPGTLADFVYKYAPGSLDVQKTSGVPALVTLAQGAVESNFGRSAPGNNFFGVKASSGWTGAVQKLKTWECGKTGNPATDGIKDEIIQIFKPGDPSGNAVCNSKGLYSYRVYGVFRKYDTARDSFLDHSKFLKADRYKTAFNYTDNAEMFIKEVAKAGYATAPGYAEYIIGVMNKIRAILSSTTSQSGKMMKPVNGPITSSFGYRTRNGKQELHNGIDIAVPVGTKILSPEAGTVAKLFNGAAGGNMVLVKHTNGYTTGYAHLSRYLVKEGDTVKRGEPIGEVGMTGMTTGPHLHFTMRDDKSNYVDPAKHIS